MSVIITTPTGSPDVTRRNTDEFLYLKGDVDTDASLRLLPDTLDQTKFEFQLRTAGVWNTTDIQISGATLFIGRDLSIGSSASWIKTSFRQDNVTALHPHVEYTDDGTQFPAWPVYTDKVFEQAIVKGDDGEVSGTSLQILIPAGSDLVVTKFTVKAGSITATEPVTVTFRDGFGGPIFFQQNISVVDFGVPEFDLIRINLTGGIAAIPGDVWHVTFESTATISLKVDTSFFNFWWFALDGFGVREEELVSDNLALTTDLDFIFTNDLDWVVGVQDRA